MRRREGFGAVWSLAAAAGFYVSIGGASDLLLLYAAVYALIAFDPLALRRRLGRLAVWLFALAVATGLVQHGLALEPLHHLLRLGLSVRPKALDTADATLLFTALLPLLVAVFEIPGGLSLRLGQLVVGAGLLSYVGGLQVEVAWEAVGLCLGFALVRYWDLAAQPARGRRSLQVYALATIALALALGQTFPSLRPGTGAGVQVQQGYPLDVAHLDHTLTPSGSQAFLAHTRAALYWQVFTAYTYTGQGWRPRGDWRALGPQDLAAAPGAGTRLVVERFSLTSNLPTDPVAGQVVKLLAPSSAWRYNAGSGAYQAPGRQIAIVAALPTVSLALASKVAVGAQGAPAAALELPRALPAEVGGLAHRIVAGVPATVGAQAQAIIRYLRGHEHYALTVPPDGGKDFVWDFLFVHHQGDCNAFSTAFVVLARLDGIPARWVAGYLPGTVVGADRAVTAADAHSWAEVWVPGHGWLSLDPTPGFALPTLQQGGGAAAAASRTGALPAVQVGALGRAQAIRLLEQAAHRQVAATAAAARASGAALYLWLALALIVLAALAGILLRPAQAEVLGLRLASRLLGRPWRQDETVRSWLGGLSPGLCRRVEWLLYRPPGACPVGFGAAWRELGELARRGGAPRIRHPLRRRGAPHGPAAR